MIYSCHNEIKANADKELTDEEIAQVEEMFADIGKESTITKEEINKFIEENFM